MYIHNIQKHGIQTKLGKNLFKLHNCFNERKQSLFFSIFFFEKLIFLNIDHF